MTHKNMYIKLMIEYNKLTENNSLSLTEYEAAVALDKAYSAVIAQKMIGNNIRRSSFESDIKSISDLYPLLKNKTTTSNIDHSVSSNTMRCNLPPDMLYFIGASATVNMNSVADGPVDGEEVRRIDFKLVDHETAKKFMASAYNVPWVKIPVCYVENKYLYIIYDLYSQDFSKWLNTDVTITYIKKPSTFVKNLEDIMNKVRLYSRLDADNIKSLSYFNYELSGLIEYDLDQFYMFECDDTVAEEVINLAISYLLENTESGRLNNKLNMRGLEA